MLIGLFCLPSFGTFLTGLSVYIILIDAFSAKLNSHLQLNSPIEDVRQTGESTQMGDSIFLSKRGEKDEN